jgi:hypothetical protein
VTGGARRSQKEPEGDRRSPAERSIKFLYLGPAPFPPEVVLKSRRGRRPRLAPPGSCCHLLAPASHAPTHACTCRCCQGTCAVLEHSCHQVALLPQMRDIVQTIHLLKIKHMMWRRCSIRKTKLRLQGLECLRRHVLREDVGAIRTRIDSLTSKQSPSHQFLHRHRRNHEMPHATRTKSFCNRKPCRSV